MGKKTFRRAVAQILIALLFTATTWAQQPNQPAKKGGKGVRIATTVAGGGLGFLAGVAIGFGNEDNISEGALLATIIFSTIGGAVGGYFIGRAVTKDRYAYQLDPVARRAVLNRVVEAESWRFREALRDSSSDKRRAE